MASQADLDRRFTYHAPKGNQPEKYVEIRQTCKDLAYLLVQLCPDSRELDAALMHLEMAGFWANAAIARNE
jgi:hypothetical protein